MAGPGTRTRDHVTSSQSRGPVDFLDMLLPSGEINSFDLGHCDDACAMYVRE
jgi:hypothetical protein